MPVYLRKFYYGKLTEAKKTEKEQIDKARKKSSSPINTPKYPNFRR
tara:strand:+ start:428 stop:565 length:138 start_codon:yes stop_codon:yes gene_type:complete